jgi:hypothetical protein
MAYHLLVLTAIMKLDALSQARDTLLFYKGQVLVGDIRVPN